LSCHHSIIFGGLNGTLPLNFNEYLVKLQILLNVISKYNFVKSELDKLVNDILKFLKDFPILGLKLKIYKTKAPQLFPTVSKFFDGEIDNILGLLEKEQYKSVLSNFEEGLKEFLLAKEKAQLKDVVEDMYTACDELAKIILKNKNKGFKHVFDKDEYEKFGFNNKSSKEIYRNLKDWMDDIKHGTLKKYERNDIEMIILLVASFIRFAINHNS